MKDFSGIYAALLTAFNEDGSINFEATGKLAERNIEKGLDGMYVAGSSGEAMMMSEEEIREVISSLEDKSIPSVMKHFKANYAGKCDMKTVSEIARRF